MIDSAQYRLVINQVYETIMEDLKSAYSREELEELLKKGNKDFHKQIEEELLITMDGQYSETFDILIQDYLESLKGIAILSPGISTGLHDSKFKITLNTYNGKMSDIPNDGLITEDTVFDASSMTKMFTSILLLKEAEKGNIDLTKTFADYSPLLRNIDIPIIDALKFSAIIMTDGRIDEKNLSREERIKRLLNANIVERETYKYSDIPYMLVPLLFGSTIEEATEKYLQKFYELFRNELGLEKTGYNKLNMSGGPVKRKFDEEENRFTYYKDGVYDPKANIFEREIGYVSGHAGVTTNVQDLEKLFDALNRGILSDKSIKTLITSVSPNSVYLLDENGNKKFRDDKPIIVNHGMGVYINTGSILNSSVFPAFSKTAFAASGSTGTNSLLDLENGFIAIKLPNYHSGLFSKWVRIDNESIGDSMNGDEFPKNSETTLISGTNSLRDGSLIRPDGTEMRPGRASNNFNAEELKTLLKLRIAKVALTIKATYEYNGEELKETLKQIDKAFNKNMVAKEKSQKINR